MLFGKWMSRFNKFFDNFLVDMAIKRKIFANFAQVLSKSISTFNIYNE